MKKCFNTTGVCYPQIHYMVDIEQRLKTIRCLIDRGDYFVISRARQYGKTTLLWSLKRYLQDEYAVISIDFQEISTADFRDEYMFVAAFADIVLQAVETGLPLNLDPDIQKELEKCANGEVREKGLRFLFRIFRKICDSSKKPVVLMIDEVDSASNNRVFLDFLSQLRNAYIKRMDIPTFQSVILAGVYDIKNLKLKIRKDSEHQYNSPWNIAADFNVDMSFSPSDIISMLREYEEDYHTGMDFEKVSALIYDYTSGYPYLVSRICQLMDERLIGTDGFTDRKSVWCEKGVLAAERLLRKEPSTLFDDMVKKLMDYPELKEMIQNMLFAGSSYSFNRDNYLINLGVTFGFLKEREGSVAISNRIFETKMYDLFLSEMSVNSAIYSVADKDKNQYIVSGMLQMDLVLKKFCEHFSEIYADCDAEFVEQQGRKMFLLYLKPIINGTGNFYIEAETRDRLRTDIIVDYKGKRFVVELKIWHGEEYNKRGEKQLINYLDYYKQDVGYLLSFNFNKKKQTGVHEVLLGGKRIVEAVV